MDAVSAYSTQQIWTSEEIGYRETARLLEKNGLAVQNGEMPALNVVLSDESLQQAAAHNAKTFAMQLDGTAADGTAVSVQRAAGIYSSTPDVQDSYISTDALEGYIYSADFTDSAGNSVNVEFTGDMKSALTADGNRSVYFFDTNTTRTYGTDGSYIDAEGDHIAADADSIFISTSGSNISTGNGNNLVFVYGDNTSIQGGSGNDDIRIAANLSNVKIDTGSGDDTVSGSRVYGLELNLNEGSNTVSFSASVVGGSITTGDGSNNLTISTASDVAVSLGDGQNTYTGGYLTNNSSLTIGDGDNTVNVRQVGATETYRSAGSSATITLGNGDNNVEIYGMHNGSQVAAANGNNSINIYEIETGSALELGNGNNNINIYELENGSTATIGNGNNNVKFYGIESGSSVSLGNGSNRAKVYQVEENSFLNFGSGNNALQLYDLYDSMLSMGSGNNDTSIYKMSGNSKMQTGDGNNIIQVENMEDESQISVGEGENAFYIGNFSSGTSILDSLGNAFDSGKINSLMEQGLWNALSDIEKVRSEREQQGETTVANFEDDDFFNTDSFSNERQILDSRSKAEIEALRSYAKASIQDSVKLTQDLLPENISRYMNDASAVESMSYFWSSSSSSEK